MRVVHANWSQGAMRLWAESLDAYQRASTGEVPAVEPLVHPFAASAEELAALLASRALLPPGSILADGEATRDALRLRIPARQPDLTMPRPSDRLTGVLGTVDIDVEPALREFVVPSLAVRTDATISALLGMEDGGPSAQVEFGHSLRYWMVVARLVLELLADQRFIPTLIQLRGSELRAAWQPWLHDDSARERVGALIAGMPPIVRAVVDEHEGRPWSILEQALNSLTDATVRRALIADDFADAIEGRDAAEDPHVAWLEGLLAERTSVTPTADGGSELLRDAGRWISGLDEARRDRSMELRFELIEPPLSALPGDLEPVADDIRWRLAFQLMSTGPDRTIIDADQIWSDPATAQAAAGPGNDPEEVLLAELGRAARIYPRLEQALSAATPVGLDLTTSEAYAFLREHKELLEESGFLVTVPSWWGKPAAQLSARLRIDAPPIEAIAGGEADGVGATQALVGFSSLVDYRWQIAVGDQPLSIEEFRKLVSSAERGSLRRLHGQWIEIRPEQIAEAAAFFEKQPGGQMTLLEAIQIAHGAGGSVDGEIGLPVHGLDASGWVADLLGASSSRERMPRLPQPESFQGTLRPYQETGLSWLSFLDRFGLGACLADDMGLGKTIQLIALLQHERERSGNGQSIGPTLLIVPTSVISNWHRELHRFAPKLTVLIHHGPDRAIGDHFIERASTHDVVITTYTLVSRDRDSIARLPWHRVVLDEAQYIKNPPTKQTATIRSLNTTRRVALTGTPVENRLSELWSIMEFCNPGYLGQSGEFRRRFAVPIERHRDQHRAEQLRKLVRPFVLRRLKTDPTVIEDLPACVTTKEYATLTPEQAALYERTVNEMLTQVGGAEGIRRRGLVLAALVKLKQICNHPAQFLDDGSANGGKRRGGVPAAGDEAGLATLSSRSGKAGRLMEMLEEIHATGDKALLFTQFRRMGHLLAAMIQHDLDAEVMFLHGGTPATKRQQMIDRFQDPDGGVPFFLLSLKAGGLGLNLTAANHVFHFDRWWNPAVENQATDRAFRIGQTRTVHVHKFVCLGTLEERIDQMIEEKTELAQNIIGAGEQWLTELSTGQLRDLLTLRDSAVEAEDGA